MKTASASPPRPSGAGSAMRGFSIRDGGRGEVHHLQVAHVVLPMLLMVPLLFAPRPALNVLCWAVLWFAEIF